MFRKLNPLAQPPPSAEITSLYIYPIKSCRGIPLSHSYLTKRGLDLDRQWMFVDAETLGFITIRQVSQLTLIDTALIPHSAPDEAPNNNNSESLCISIRNTDQKVIIPARPTPEWLQDNTELKNVKIWDYETDGYVYGEGINNLFSKFLDKPVKLVYKGPTPRKLSGNGALRVLGREGSTNFPDVLPVLLVNEASMDELNSRLKEKGSKQITVERFRPNVVIRGEPVGDAALGPWSEDSWKLIRIVNQPAQQGILGWSGDGGKGLELDVQARCARCQVPNVDPETAEKDLHEPWDTLVSYRRIDPGIKWKPCFGMLSVPRNEGPIEVGMKFEILETTEEHKYLKGF